VLPNVPARKIARSVHEAARDKARAIARTEAYAVPRRQRKKVELLFAHLKRILRLDRLPARPARSKDEFLLAATAQNPAETDETYPAPGARIRYIRRRGSTSPRPQLPPAHIAIFKAPGSARYPSTPGGPECANAAFPEYRSQRVESTQASA
jgi:hypothetical protein